MQQRGSKYDQKIKDEALALVASGVSITNAACRLRIPKSTLADWVHTQNEGDEDGVAARREIRRKQIARCEKIGDKVLRALDRKAEAAVKDTKTVNDGLAVLEKAAKDGVIALTEAEIAGLRDVVKDYTGIGLRELAGTMKDVAARTRMRSRRISARATAAKSRSPLRMDWRSWRNEKILHASSVPEAGALYEKPHKVHRLWRIARRRQELHRPLQGRDAVYAL